jgi:glycosyltransferase involved in cell wall biosynthesis
MEVPRIVSPRGMLSEWALQQGSARKRAIWWLYLKRDLDSASLLHATAHSEASDFRNCGLTAPIAVLPNGVNLPPQLDRRDLRSRPERVALFLSRLHPKKGLLDLIEAWSVLRPPNWRLVIAGDDEGGHRAVVEKTAAQRGVRDLIDFVGPVGDAAKWDLYATAELFILPSYSENFGIVVAEALAAGVPVITTRATPWKELQDIGCGWWIDTGAASLTSALREGIQASDETRVAMGKRGRELVETRYSWASAAEKMLACYRWLLGQQEKPECVNLSDAA